MRIIAGQRRGHKFDGPKDHSTRPTSDLVREALFNILGEAVDGMLVVDLFAGTGAIGLEALSRGAARAIFVERNRDNVGLIRRNVATLRYEDRAAVIGHDAYRWARAYTAEDAEPVVVFVDPPYSDYDKHPDRIHKLLEGLLALLPAGSILAAESRIRLDETVLPDPGAWDVRRYGGTQVAIRTVGDPERFAAAAADDDPDAADGDDPAADPGDAEEPADGDA